MVGASSKDKEGVFTAIARGLQSWVCLDGKLRLRQRTTSNKVSAKGGECIDLLAAIGLYPTICQKIRGPLRFW